MKTVFRISAALLALAAAAAGTGAAVSWVSRMSNTRSPARLFSEEDVRIYAPKSVTYDCRRDVRKVESMLRFKGCEDANGAS